MRRYGCNARGNRLVEPAPHGHRRTTTFVAGLRSARLVAPFVLDGPTKGEAFVACVERYFAPVLSPGNVVVMNNFGAHKVAGVAEAIATVGASTLYLPPYRPVLNPIEQMFAKVKALLRKTAARSREGLWNAIRQLLGAFNSNDGCFYIRHAEYA
jgi:transposase